MIIFIKKHKKGLTILCIISLIIAVIGGTLYICIINPLKKAQKEYDENAITEPYIYLRNLEKSFKLVPKSELDIGYEKFKFYKATSPFKSTTYDQLYKAFSFENNNENESEYISLDCRYWYITEFSTLTEMINGDGILSNMTQNANILKDSRFDKYYLAGILGFPPIKEDQYSILVIKGKHIMMLDYMGGNLTPEDFLNELAKILP
jgi:hypothetical protein